MRLSKASTTCRGLSRRSSNPPAAPRSPRRSPHRRQGGIPHRSSLKGAMSMTIKVGDKLPSVTLRYAAPDGVKAVTTEEFFGGKKVVLFGLPGAYTRTCSERHLPGYITHAA